jgi:uncharacterized protein with PQ loop repeat
MTPQNLLNIAGFLQTVVPVISLIAYLPQWKKLIDTKSSKDISLRSWSIWVVSSSISVFYALALYQVTHKGIPLIIASIAGLLFVLVTVYLTARYRNRKDD